MAERKVFHTMEEMTQGADFSADSISDPEVRRSLLVFDDAVKSAQSRTVGADGEFHKEHEVHRRQKREVKLTPEQVKQLHNLLDTLKKGAFGVLSFESLCVAFMMSADDAENGTDPSGTRELTILTAIIFTGIKILLAYTVEGFVVSLAEYETVVFLLSVVVVTMWKLSEKAELARKVKENQKQKR